MTDLHALLACPRCDKTPLEQNDDTLHCNACKIDFPTLDAMPWMFAEPDATLGDCRGRPPYSSPHLSTEVTSRQPSSV